MPQTTRSTCSPRSAARTFTGRLLVATMASAGIPAQVALAASASTPASQTTPKEDAIVLSPFSVNASSDTGYAATSTLGGTRLKSELRDVASQIDVMTSEFLDDIGALTLDEAVRYSMNIESNDENFSPGTQADPAAEPKGAPWKVAVPAWMKQNTEASNGWLAERLGVGGRRVSVIPIRSQDETNAICRSLLAGDGYAGESPASRLLHAGRLVSS